MICPILSPLIQSDTESSHKRDTDMNNETAAMLLDLEIANHMARVYNQPTGAFKRRHLKKVMAKIDARQPLMPGETRYFDHPDDLPEYDMDGSPFGCSEFVNYDSAMCDPESER